MENLLKQMRGGFPGAGQGKTEESIRNQRIPPQKTQSFKREKRTQNWLRRPFSGKIRMSSNGDSDHKLEQVLAVAAATYVVNSIAKQSIQDQKMGSAGVEPSLIREKSRKEDKSSSISEPGTISERFSGEGSRKGSGSAESNASATDGTDGKEIKRAPSFRKSLTFADHLGSTSITRPRSSPKPDMLSGQTESAAPNSNHPAIIPGTAGRSDEPVVPETEQTKAEAWLKDEMAKIKERYTKLKNTILAWEEKKKRKAKNKLHRAESGLERKRERALIKFKNEMDHIKQAVDGARAKTDASQRNDELKAKEKPNTIILVWEEKKKKAKNKLNRAERGLERKRAQALLKFKKEMDYVKQAADGARAQAEASQRNDELKAKEKANIIRTTGEVPRTCICG
ncbi:hypothetical protein V6N13_099787 [Hibiscus sabdariffa]|uniref:Remorin C-terminal domain-containing protein n=1 Tax=Hibiscus sabdariffa TaxID=183260 RepID=A0ABR2A2J5_9ROSI